jgi:hypothetical protein
VTGLGYSNREGSLWSLVVGRWSLVVGVVVGVVVVVGVGVGVIFRFVSVRLVRSLRSSVF